MPLHPAIVHIPVALALLLPLLIPIAGFLWWREKKSRAPLWLVAILAGIMGVSTFAAMQTGEEDEEIVEEVVNHDALEAHEHAAERFAWVAGGIAVISVGTLLAASTGAAIPLIAILWVASVAGAYQAYVTGHAGGELVYVHNAASAHTLSR